MSHLIKNYTVDLDEVAHHEPPHQKLHCLQIQQISSLVVKELIWLVLHVTQSIFT